MTKPGNAPTREERLAAKLRENLRRRKVQARAQGKSEQDSDSDKRDGPLPKNEPKS